MSDTNTPNQPQLVNRLTQITKQINAIEPHFSPGAQMEKITILMRSKTGNTFAETMIQFPDITMSIIPDSFKEWLSNYLSTLILNKEGVTQNLEEKLK